MIFPDYLDPLVGIPVAAALCAVWAALIVRDRRRARRR